MTIRKNFQEAKAASLTINRYFTQQSAGPIHSRRIQISQLAPVDSPELRVGDKGYLLSSTFYEPALFLRDDGELLYLIGGDKYVHLYEKVSSTIGFRPTVTLNHDTTMWKEGFELSNGPHAFVILNTMEEAQEVAEFAKQLPVPESGYGWTVDVVGSIAWSALDVSTAKQALKNAASLFRGI